MTPYGTVIGRLLKPRRGSDGRDLPARDLPAAIIQPGGPDGPAYTVYDNYRVLLQWNRSDYFAASVGTLANSLAE